MAYEHGEGGVKLSSRCLDDIVAIPGAKDMGSAETPQVLRESSFHASDGWDIERVQIGAYRLFREPMKKPCTIEGYGATWVAADDDCMLSEVDPTGLVVPKPPKKAGRK